MIEILCAISLGKRINLGEICIVLVKDRTDNSIYWAFAYSKKIDENNCKYYIIDKNKDIELAKKVAKVLTPQDWVDIAKITEKFETLNKI